MIHELCARRCDTNRLFEEEAKLRHHTPETGKHRCGGGWWLVGQTMGPDLAISNIRPGNMQAELRQDLVQLGQGCGRAPPTEQ